MASFCRGSVLCMAITLSLLMTGRAQSPKGPGKEVVDLAQQAEAGKDIDKKASQLKKRFANVRAAMNMFNPRERGGIGSGSRGVAIEHRLINLEEKGLSEETLKQESANLVRIAQVTLVMAEVTRGFAPAKPFLGKGKKEWERDIDELKTSSKSFLKAVKDGSPRDVQAAARRINNACTNCHDGK